MATFYFHIAFRLSTLSVGQYSFVINFKEATATSQTHLCIMLDQLLDDGLFRIKRGIFSGTELAVSDTPIVADTWYWLAFKGIISNTVGEATLYLNGNQVATYSGDTQNGGASYIQSVSAQTQLAVTNATLDIDDLVILNSTAPNNAILTERIVDTIMPSGAGNSTQWTPSTGSNYQCVDDTNEDDDTTYISSNTANHIDTYAFGDVSLSSVDAIRVCWQQRHDDAGSHTVAPIVRPSSTDRVGTAISTGVGYEVASQLYDVSPETSSAFTPSEINGCEFGLKLVS